MHGLKALLDYAPNIARALREFPDAMHEHVFDALVQVILEEVRQPAGYDSGSATYDPSHTTVMPAYREDLGTR